MKFLLHLATIKGPYGLFRDELYFIVCGRRLDWGYVDHPPIVPLLARMGETLFGPFGVRVLPALAGAAMVVLAMLMARALGGGRFAQALAAVGVIIAPHYLASQAKLSTDAIEPLFWTLCCYALVRLLQTEDPRWWVAFGVFAGLGLETKHSTAFFGAAIVIAFLLTPERRLLWNRWLWTGGAIAFLIALPNVIWEAQHHWATLELLRNVKASGKNVVLGPGQYFAQQLLNMHPLGSLLWLAGLVWLFLPAGRRYRIFAWGYVALFVIFVALAGKAYYLASYYVVLYSAGAAWIASLTEARPRVRAAIVAVLVVTALPLLPLVLPILPPERLAAYQRAIHVSPSRSERSHTSELAQHFSDRLGWPEMVGSVVEVYRSLPPEEQKRTEIFAQNFGEAGAIDVLGGRAGLPPALSGHQNYFLWGTHGFHGDTLIVMDDDPGSLPQLCDSVEDRGQVRTHPYAMPWEQRQHLYVCRGLKKPLEDVWPKVKSWY